jgi:hypothetical protein
MRRIMGYAPEALLGAGPADMVHPDDVAEVDASIARLCASPRPRRSSPIAPATPTARGG